MSLTESNMMPLGENAIPFSLTDVISNTKMSWDEIKGKKGTFLMFICNHCPYVVHIQDELVKLAKDYQVEGISFCAISSNDIENHPLDSPKYLKEQAKKVGFQFPYLYDETQQVAKEYMAACTPDFYLFNEKDKLIYRGRIDDSRPNSGIPVTGKEIRNVFETVLKNEPITTKQFPSMGCNIKWKK